MTDQNTLFTIRKVALDVEVRKDKLKNLKEQAEDIVAEMPEYQEAQKTKLAFDAAKEKLRLALLNEPHHNDLLEEIAQEKQDLDDDKDVLSLHLVEYYTATHERQVELNENTGDAREVIVTGKLGKKQKFQTNIFGGNHGTES